MFPVDRMRHLGHTDRHPVVSDIGERGGGGRLLITIRITASLSDAILLPECVKRLVNRRAPMRTVSARIYHTTRARRKRLLLRTPGVRQKGGSTSGHPPAIDFSGGASRQEGRFGLRSLHLDTSVFGVEGASDAGSIAPQESSSERYLIANAPAPAPGRHTHPFRLTTENCQSCQLLGRCSHATRFVTLAILNYVVRMIVPIF